MKKLFPIIGLFLFFMLFSCAGALSDVDRSDKAEALIVKGTFENFVQKLEVGNVLELQSFLAENKNFKWNVIRQESERFEEVYTNPTDLSAFYREHYTKLASNKITLSCPRGVSMLSESRARVFFQYNQTIVDQDKVVSKYQGHFFITLRQRRERLEDIVW